MTDDKPLRLGETLVEAGVLTTEQLERALSIQKERQLRLGTILLQEGFVAEPQLVQALSRRLSIPWVSLWHLDIPEQVIDLVPVNVAEEFFLIPIYIRTTAEGERSLFVAMNDPTDDSALRFVAATAGMPVKPMIAGPSDIAAAIRDYYYDEEDDEDVLQAHTTTSSIPPPAQSGPPQPPTVVSARPSSPPPAPSVEPGARISTPPPPPDGEDIEELHHAEALEETPDGDVSDLIEEAAAESEDAAAEEEAAEAEADEGATDEDQDAAEGDAGEDSEDDGDEAEGGEPSEPPSQRDAEHVLLDVAARALMMTLLDGTAIPFGQAAKKRKTDELTPDDVVAGLRAAAEGTPIEGFLPTDSWQAYMAALLEILFRKHLVFFDEYMKELKKKG